MHMSSVDYNYLFSLARASINHGLIHDAPLFMNPRFIDPVYLTMERTFVSLKMHGKNAGCIGNIVPEMFYHTVLTNAFKAAFRDKRFPPLNKNSMKKIYIQLHHLVGRPRPVTVQNIDELKTIIQPTDTLQLEFNDRKATMLAFVQKEHTNLDGFITATMDKANIPRSADWSQIKVLLSTTVETDIRNLMDIEPCQKYV